MHKYQRCCALSTHECPPFNCLVNNGQRLEYSSGRKGENIGVSQRI